MIATATIGYEPWPPLVGAALDEADLTGVVVLPFVGVRCMLVQNGENGWTLPTTSLEHADHTWRDAVERVLRTDTQLRLCDTTPFGLLRGTSTSDDDKELSVVAWAECAAPTAHCATEGGPTNTVDVDVAARLLEPTWPLGAHLCCVAARLRRNTCHRPITG